MLRGLLRVVFLDRLLNRLQVRNSLMDTCFFAEQDCAAGWPELRAVMIGVHFGELGAEEKDLRRVVDPGQQHEKRAGRAVCRREAAAAQVQSDCKLAQREER